jgi:hypothetical protein
MKLVKNTGTDRVIDELRKSLLPPSSLDLASADFSLFAYAELRDLLEKLETCRIILPNAEREELGLTGSNADRAFRNHLQLRWLARECGAWIRRKAELRIAPGRLPQSILIGGVPESEKQRVITGNCAFTTEGLGITPGNQFGLIQCSEKPEESAVLGSWFTSLWSALPASDQHKAAFLSLLQELADSKAPSLVYYLTLFQVFKDLGDELDEERIVKSATGIRNTTVWKKLYKFQRDGVIGAIDKLERHGGCIIADSVGLGKTFEALAIIKYYELRNDRVLVLVPKRLRDNWTLYKANDRRNFLASDRFNYDVLNHTDLSRDGGTSGDIDLAHVNWGNYDLVVIDESHNFRNKATHNSRETRYDRLMHRTIKAGVKTRVLMLSATPVNNRLADLKNQIAFVTEANDTALTEHGIPSIEATVRQAQLQFNRWMTLDDRERRPAHLLEMLGFDYFRLLDLLTIARSRKHIEKYYGTKETGRFPERLKPVNIKREVDLSGEFRSIREINNEIRRLTLAAYAPLRYQRIGNEEYYAQELFELEELTGYLKNMLNTDKSVYEQVVYDSAGVERTFAEQLEKNEAVKVYAKLPGWFKVPTPLGTYNPDWAVLVEKDGVERLYFVVETKSSLFTDDLRDKESAKIECGKAHFKALAVGENPAGFVTARNIDYLMARC